jgi:5'(3')-deoxyribonucleotidase
MDKIKVYVDFDSTLVNSTKRLVEMLNIKFNKNADWTKIKKYNCEDLFQEVTPEQVTEIFASKDFFYNLHIFDNANEVLSIHRSIFDYEITTIGTSENLYWKERWCNQYLEFPFVFNGIMKNEMGKGKDVCDMSGGIIIDDHIDNIFTSNATHKILYKGKYETEWNTIPSDSNITALIAKHWLEVNHCFNRILVQEGRI